MINELVLAGGGIKVVAIAGALEKLSKEYDFEHIIELQPVQY